MSLDDILRDCLIVDEAERPAMEALFRDVFMWTENKQRENSTSAIIELAEKDSDIRLSALGACRRVFAGGNLNNNLLFLELPDNMLSTIRILAKLGEESDIDVLFNVLGKVTEFEPRKQTDLHKICDAAIEIGVRIRKEDEVFRKLETRMAGNKIIAEIVISARGSLAYGLLIEKDNAGQLLAKLRDRKTNGSGPHAIPKPVKS
jgi:hypothetical protein